MPHINIEEKRAYIREYIKRPDQQDKRKAYRQANKDKQPGYHRKWQEAHPESYLLSVAKDRARKRGIEFSLTIDDFTVPNNCPILGIELQFAHGKGKGGQPNSPSLDRIDNSKGYISGNVQVISHLANSMKSTASKEQLLKFANWIKEKYETPSAT